MGTVVGEQGTGDSTQSRHAGPRLAADASASGTAFVPGGAADLESCLVTCSQGGGRHILTPGPFQNLNFLMVLTFFLV